MIRQTAAALAAALALTACSSSVNGDTESKTIALADIDELSVASGFTVTIRKGNTTKLELTAHPDIINKVKTDVSGKKLSLFINGSDDKNGATKRAVLTVKDLRSIDQSGGSLVTCLDTFRAAKFEAELSGGSRLDLLHTGTELELDFSGGSTVNAHGRSNKIDVEMSGGSTYNGFSYFSRIGEFGFSGGSTGYASVSDTAEARLTGASRLVIKGSPSVQKDLTGGSTVEIQP